MSNHTHHLKFKTLKRAWKASKYFIVGLSCLYKFNLKSLVQTALTTLAMITLTSLVITAIIYISVGNAKAKPTSKPTIQQTQQPQNHTSPFFTEHNYKSTHTSIQSTTLSQLPNTDTTRETTYSHSINETQNRKIKSQSTLPATRKPPINPSGSNPPENHQDHNNSQTLPYVPCSTCEGNLACLSLCQIGPERAPSRAPTITLKKTPKPKTTKKPTKTTIHHRTSPEAKLQPKNNTAAPQQGILSSPEHHTNQSTTQI
ncbi:attachment glycoprotein [bovine respiratory syncytial virus]|uniref:Major surface glycoprotein G n=1 Tax=Bovine orthopneumovirus TaxID=11246 RepID=Q9YS25_9MONO|nr:attachment glycoprotein [Bovine orthopneumovirus]YP_009505454.1 attachment glycoprotein [Bovine respiratory syncytial virus ATCC51908]AAC96307.1 attachment glycoprotein [Bovine orthopneumovirus]AAL49398.1 attachment glycoprotein [Bovine respiratory syncytial virus ATCC51908]